MESIRRKKWSRGRPLAYWLLAAAACISGRKKLDGKRYHSFQGNFNKPGSCEVQDDQSPNQFQMQAFTNPSSKSLAEEFLSGRLDLDVLSQAFPTHRLLAETAELASLDKL